MIFVESDDTVSDSYHVSFLDEIGVISFEEGFGGGSLVGYNAINFGYLEPVASFNEAIFCGYNFDVNVISVTEILELFDFDESRL